jgi:SNF2 family DNA or RNA helicase
LIALSATPIKNRFDEYYPVCHMINPDKYGSYNTFVEQWCEFVYKGSYAKVRGCIDPKGWAEFTKDDILHIKKEDVLPDLPKIRRDFRYYDLADEVKQAYEDKLAEFTDYFESTSDTGFALAQNLLAYFAAMRQLTAISKVTPCKEFVEDFLLSTERKIVVFVHHHLAADMLIAGLNEVLTDGGYSPCLYFKGGLTDKEADRIKSEFINNPARRVLIASTLSAGEGLDGLQNVCSDLVMMERQWNPANEEQVEGRLERIGQAFSIMASYLIALGTIDEWLTELVESKREMLKTAEGQEAKYNENSIMMELAEMIMSKRGGKKWS